MATGPGPSLVDVVIGHENFVVSAVRDPTGGGEMTEFVIAQKDVVRESLDHTEHSELIVFFLFVEWMEGLDFGIERGKVVFHVGYLG